MKSKRLAHWRTVSIEGGKIQREPIIFREPAELSSGEGRPEDPAHAVAVPFERLAHETQEQMPVAGLHEWRTALGGDHQAGGDLRPRMEGIRRQLHAGGEPVPGAPVQSLQRGWLLSRVLQGYLLLHHQVNTLGGSGRVVQKTVKYRCRGAKRDVRDDSERLFRKLRLQGIFMDHQDVAVIRKRSLRRRAQ
jgi:hypothetical protein